MYISWCLCLPSPREICTVFPWHLAFPLWKYTVLQKQVCRVHQDLDLPQRTSKNFTIGPSSFPNTPTIILFSLYFCPPHTSKIILFSTTILILIPYHKHAYVRWHKGLRANSEVPGKWREINLLCFSNERKATYNAWLHTQLSSQKELVGMFKKRDQEYIYITFTLVTKGLGPSKIMDSQAIWWRITKPNVWL